MKVFDVASQVFHRFSVCLGTYIPRWSPQRSGKGCLCPLFEATTGGFRIRVFVLDRVSLIRSMVDTALSTVCLYRAL